MNWDYALLCIDTQSGRIRRYVPTRLFGMRVRAAGELEIQSYHPCRPIPVETLQALEYYRSNGTLIGA